MLSPEGLPFIEPWAYAPAPLTTQGGWVDIGLTSQWAITGTSAIMLGSTAPIYGQTFHPLGALGFNPAAPWSIRFGFVLTQSPTSTMNWEASIGDFSDSARMICQLTKTATNTFTCNIKDGAGTSVSAGGVTITDGSHDLEFRYDGSTLKLFIDTGLKVTLTSPVTTVDQNGVGLRALLQNTTARIVYATIEVSQP